MTDLLDQIEEARNFAASKVAPKTVTEFTYVFQINSKWHQRTLKGPLHECTEHIVKEIEDLGSDITKIRWGRTHYEDGVPVMHPKSDLVTERRLLYVMGRKAKQKPKQASKR